MEVDRCAMWDESKDRVVVAVAPRGDHDAVLEYAAAEAVRRGTGIHLVLVMHPQWPGPDGLAEVRLEGGELVRVESEVLRACEERLGEWLHESVPVTTEVVHGAVAPSVVAASRRASVVLLQHHRMTRPNHLPTLSVTNGVASRARVPVVAVPDRWHESAARDAPVVAGLENGELSWQVATHALAAGRRTDSPVRLLRAWSYADDLALRDPVFRTTTTAEWERHLVAQLEDELSGLTGSYPDVSCSVRVAHGQPAYVLATASAQARLMVLGRHEPTLPFGSHLGPVTRTVLTYGRCPVMVVDAGPADTPAG
jgi:nucleotide-binding universal stress UspA family protein